MIGLNNMALNKKYHSVGEMLVVVALFSPSTSIGASICIFSWMFVSVILDQVYKVSYIKNLKANEERNVILFIITIAIALVLLISLATIIHKVLPNHFG